MFVAWAYVVNLWYHILESGIGDSMRDMMLTMDEYMAFRRLIDSERESEGATLAQEPVKRTRKPSAYNRRFAAAYRKIAKAKPRSKHVSIMRQAHKMARRKK